MPRILVAQGTTAGAGDVRQRVERLGASSIRSGRWRRRYRVGDTMTA
jgi:hypothetical protein